MLKTLWTRSGESARVVRALALVLVATLWAVSARAEEGARDRIVVERAAAVPGSDVGLAVVIEHAEGWHTWPHAAVALPAVVADLAIRTEAEVVDPPAWLRVGPAQFPKTKDGPVADPSGQSPTVTVPLFSGTAPVLIPMRLAADAPAGSHELKVRVQYQACNDVTCQMPVMETRTVTLVVAAAAGVANEPALFTGMKPLEGGGGAAPPPANAAPASPERVRPNLFGYELPDPSSAAGLLVLGLVAALGGFILNLTPCVLPVIPIKVLTLTQHAGTGSRALALGLWMALGVVAFWAAIGVPMAFVSSALDPSRYIFGTWWVTFGIGLIIAMMALGMMGLFVVNLPQSVYMVNPKADSAWGSFLFGVMTAVLGLPCFGLVAGGLLAGAATLPWYTIMVIFGGLGVGMAAPYLVLSAKPGLLKFMPRTGPASELVKQVMGLLLLAAAAFFIAAGLKTLISARPYLAETIGWWAVLFFVVLASVWLTLRVWQIKLRPVIKVVLPVGGLALSAAFYAFASGLTDTARTDFEQRIATQKTDDGVSLVPGVWQPWTPARLDKARSEGKVVVVDFTADWCVNCKFLKRTVLDRDPVRARVGGAGYALLEVDLSDRDAPGWAYLQEATGQTGVPTLLIYGPGLANPVVFNAYTSENVMSALDRAGGPVKPQARVGEGS
jgi:thiol:disulfide interchange protein